MYNINISQAYFCPKCDIIFQNNIYRKPILQKITKKRDISYLEKSAESTYNICPFCHTENTINVNRVLSSQEEMKYETDIHNHIVNIGPIVPSTRYCVLDPPSKGSGAETKPLENCSHSYWNRRPWRRNIDRDKDCVKSDRIERTIHSCLDILRILFQPQSNIKKELQRIDADSTKRILP